MRRMLDCGVPQASKHRRQRTNHVHGVAEALSHCKVQHEILESPVKVYNFQAEEYHTYYVSDAGVLVHNTCPKRRVGGKGWEGDQIWRENAEAVRGGGTMTHLNGGISTQSEAARLIDQASGTILKIENAHPKEMCNPRQCHAQGHRIS